MADRPPQGETKVAQRKFLDMAREKTWPPECLVRRRTVDAAPEEPSPRVQCDRAQLIPEIFLVEMSTVFFKEG
jgi:hypothetical protein